MPQVPQFVGSHRVWTHCPLQSVAGGGQTVSVAIAVDVVVVATSVVRVAVALAVTVTVCVGVGAVLVEAVTPQHEHALLYWAAPAQAVAYGGTLVARRAIWRSSMSCTRVCVVVEVSNAVDVVRVVKTVENGVMVCVTVAVTGVGVTVTARKLLQSERCKAVWSARVPVTARTQLFP